MQIEKTTPIFFVERIESALPYFRDSLGYQVVAEVPHGEGLGFVILVRDHVEVMLQSLASAQDDVPQAMALIRMRGVAHYHEVDSLDALAAAVAGETHLLGPRQTAYGMREIWVADRAGFVHAYAQKGTAPA